MSSNINSVNSEELRLRFAAMAKARSAEKMGGAGTISQVNTQGIKPGVINKPLEGQNIDTSRITELAKKYAAGSIKPNPSVEAAAVSVSAPVPQLGKQPQISGIDTKTALALRGANNIVTPNAVKYVSQMAASPYQLTAKSYPNMDIYNQLANIKLG